MSEKKKVMKFKYKFDDYYNPTYINGAYGGISAYSEIVIHFYQERTCLPFSQTHEIKNNIVGDIIKTNPDDLDQSILRFIKTGITMDLRTAKTIHKFIGDKIEEVEKLQSEIVKIEKEKKEK